MTKYRIIYLLLLVGSLIFALCYESRLTLILVIAVAVMPVVTFLLLILTRLLLKIEVSPKNTMVHKLQQFSVMVTVKNRFILPASPICITGVFHDEDGNVVDDRCLIVSAMPFSSTEFLFSGNIRYRGEYTLGLRRAEVYDLLRIFKLRIRLTPDCSVIVAPRRLSIESNNALCSDDYDSTRTTVSFFENNSFASVRKYAEGDSLRFVHWKLSAKQDELMVKQMEQNLGSNAAIIADTSAYSSSEINNIRAADAVVEAAIAVSRKIISDGRCAVNIFRAVDGSADIIAAENEQDFERLYYTYSVIPVANEGMGAVSLIKEMGDIIANSETLFIIAPDFSADDLRSALMCGAKMCKNIRIYLTAGDADDELSAVAASQPNISIFAIDPEDIALSLRNSMEQ